MAPYRSDRKFTDFVHTELAIPLIYNQLGWTAVEMDPEVLKKMDMHQGVDYVLSDENGVKIGVQERFRGAEYAKYSDATLRFRRDGNSHKDRVASEFYKIYADYLVYGITNGIKEKRATLSGFEKWVVLKLSFLREKYKSGHIILDRNGKLKRCRREEDKLRCPELFNRDGSSSFVPFDIPLLFELWGPAAVHAQKGFLT